MRPQELLISIIDLLLIFVIILLLAFYAIRYDANKGIGEHDYVKINNLISCGEDNVDGDYESLDFIAVVLKKDGIELYHYKDSTSSMIGSFSTVKELVKSNCIKANSTYVIYEKEDNDYLSKIIRLFLMNNIPVGVAHVKT